MIKDLLVAWRFLIKRPTATVLAVLTLGITVGLSAIAVGAIDEAFLRSSGAGRGGLVTLYDHRPSAPHYQTLSYPDYLQVRERWRGRVDLAAFVRVEATLAGGPWPARVWGELVSGAGRDFDARDRRGAEPVAIINEPLAGLLKGEAVGQTLRLSGEPTPRRIVGIVPEMKYNGLTDPSQPFLYVPVSQALRREMYVHLRTRAAGAELLLRTELQQLNPDVALSEVRTFSQHLDDARTTPRASAYVSAGAAFIAVFLALVGLYGVLMTSVEHRQRELAIRAALGATPGQIVVRVVKEGFVLTIAGLALGMLVSLQAGALVASLLFGVAPRDPIVVTIVPLLVLLVSAVAWFAPARRAAAVDPIVALRSQ